MASRYIELAGLITEIEKKFHIDIPDEIKTIHNVFKRAGRKLYLVGGAVRDALLGKIPKDFDLVTDTPPETVIKILNNNRIKSVPKGIAFGVVSAIINGKEFEIATAREESYEGGEGRRPTSVAFSTIEMDAKRRDLTLNALYYDIDREKVIDLVGGIEDIKNKKIRTVGNAIERFEEDRLRTLRILRFSHRFGSELDADTVQAIIHFKSLPGVSAERIRAEFLGGLHTAIKPEEFLKDYKRFGLFPRIFGKIIINTNFINGLRDPVLVLANLLSLNTVEVVMMALKEFTATNTEKDNIRFLLTLKNRFEDFSKVDFNLLSDGKWLLGLKKFLEQSNTSLTNEQILEWAKINNLNTYIIQKFIEFQPVVIAKDFPELQGQELGIAIIKANAKNFVENL